MIKARIGMIVRNKSEIRLESDVLEFKGEIVGIAYRYNDLGIQIKILEANLPNYVGEKFWFDESEIEESRF